MAYETKRKKCNIILIGFSFRITLNILVTLFCYLLGTNFVAQLIFMH